MNKLSPQNTTKPMMEPSTTSPLAAAVTTAGTDAVGVLL